MITEYITKISHSESSYNSIINPNTYRLSVIVPAKNESRRIGRTLQDLHQTLCALHVPYEIIVIDDGSTDETARVAKLNGVRVITHKKNMGIAAAFRSGARASFGEVVMLCPADIDNFGFLSDAMYASKHFDVISISKRHSESIVVGYSTWRWLMSNGYQKLVDLLFSTSKYCTDTHYIKFYNGSMIRNVLDKCTINGPVGETELMLCAKDAGSSFYEIPAKIIHNVHNSKTSKKMVLQTIRELIILRIRRRKFYTFRQGISTVKTNVDFFSFTVAKKAKDSAESFTKL
jgi:dolichyl-phosphate beta-glucosyltransferase